MRTTVRLKNDLLIEAKSFALQHHRTLTSLFEEGLKRVLSVREERPSKRLPIKLPTFGKKGLRSNVGSEKNFSRFL